jgi:hypothetical protein
VLLLSSCTYFEYNFFNLNQQTMSREFKVKTDIVTNNYIDSQTGELLDVETEIKHHKIIVDDKESFGMMYATVLGALYKLNGSCIKVLMYCSINSKYNTNVIVLNSYFCEEIGRTTGLSVSAVKNAIVTLKKEKFLFRVAQGTYKINPNYFWKGQSKDRAKAKKFLFEIECIY